MSLVQRSFIACVQYGSARVGILVVADGLVCQLMMVLTSLCVEHAVHTSPDPRQRPLPQQRPLKLRRSSGRSNFAAAAAAQTSPQQRPLIYLVQPQ
jgi:hypothetical protein